MICAIKYVQWFDEMIARTCHLGFCLQRPLQPTQTHQVQTSSLFPQQQISNAFPKVRRLNPFKWEFQNNQLKSSNFLIWCWLNPIHIVLLVITHLFSHSHVFNTRSSVLTAVAVVRVAECRCRVAGCQRSHLTKWILTAWRDYSPVNLPGQGRSHRERRFRKDTPPYTYTG